MWMILIIVKWIVQHKQKGTQMAMDKWQVLSTIDSFIEEHHCDDENYFYMDGSETVKLFDDFALVFSYEQLIYVVMGDGQVLHDMPQSTDDTLRTFLYFHSLNWKGEPMGEWLEL